MSSIHNIFDVANLAGVSKSTVSRVINNKGKIRASTREKVESAMRELNYSPSYFAQGIRTGKTRSIALVIPEITNLYYNELLNAIEKAALLNDYMVMLCNGGGDEQRTMAYLERLQQRHIDGIIFCVYRNSEINEKMYQFSMKTPTVLVDHPLNSNATISSVSADGLQDIANVISILRAGGCYRIGFIGLSNIVTTIYRFMGYRAGIVACGESVDPALVYQTSYSEIPASMYDIGYQGAEKLMAQQNPPKGIVCATDMLAIGAIRYLLEAGYRIPEDVRVTGYDDIALSKMVFPAISTVAQPIAEMGKAAVDILFKKMQDGNDYNQQLLLPSTFIQRDST